ADLAVIDAIDADFRLLADHIGDDALHLAGKHIDIDRRARGAGIEELGHVLRPRQRAGMRDHDTLFAFDHLAPLILWRHGSPLLSKHSDARSGPAIAKRTQPCVACARGRMSVGSLPAAAAAQAASIWARSENPTNAVATFGFESTKRNARSGRSVCASRESA